MRRMDIAWREEDIYMLLKDKKLYTDDGIWVDSYTI